MYANEFSPVGGFVRMTITHWNVMIICVPAIHLNLTNVFV